MAHEAAGKFLAQLAQARDTREAINLLMEKAGSDIRMGEDESWDDFRRRARPELERIKAESRRVR